MVDRLEINKYDSGLRRITAFIPEEVGKPKKKIKKEKEEEWTIIWPVPIYEVWDTISLYNIIGTLSCFSPAFTPMFIWNKYDSPYHIETLEEDFLWETGHGRAVTLSFETEPLRFYTIRSLDLGYDITETEYKIEEVKSIAVRNTHYLVISEEESSESTGWIWSDPQGDFPGNPWWQWADATYTETSTGSYTLYLNFILDEAENQYPDGPIFLDWKNVITTTHVSKVTRYHPDGDVSHDYEVWESTVTGTRTGPGISILSSSVVLNQPGYIDFSHYCFVFSRGEWQYSKSDYCTSGNPVGYSLSPEPNHWGQSIGCFTTPVYVINYYINCDGVEYLIHTGNSQSSVNSWFCDIFEVDYSNLAFVYSWVENSGISFSPIAYHYGMIYNGSHYHSESFTNFINTTNDYRHRFTGEYIYPDGVNEYGGLGYLRVGKYTEKNVRKIVFFEEEA